ncbi:MAG: GNAT family N-acetyltransferase [Erysipelotrichaceae bacterium]|nr:GNAT family N-acetyltransferase [Erysipelotrichaceae bacterium]
MSEIDYKEVILDEEILSCLIAFSCDWEKENSTYGYRANTKEDIEGNRIFVAEKEGQIIAYLFGHQEHSENMRSIMKEGTLFFEVEELYVIPKERNQGIGTKLFRYLEEILSEEEYIVLSTATKNYKSILHFYLDELDMEFWSARLYKRIRKGHSV